MRINQNGMPRGTTAIIARARKDGVLVSANGARITLTGTYASLDALQARLSKTARTLLIVRVSNAHGEHVCLYPESPVFTSATDRAPRLAGAL